MANVNHLFLNNILYFLKKHICNNKNRLSVPAGFQFPFRRFAVSDKQPAKSNILLIRLKITARIGYICTIIR